MCATTNDSQCYTISVSDIELIIQRIDQINASVCKWLPGCSTGPTVSSKCYKNDDTFITASSSDCFYITLTELSNRTMNEHDHGIDRDIKLKLLKEPNT